MLTKISKKLNDFCMKNDLIQQIFRFGIVGVIAFVIDYSLLYALTEFCHIHYMISSFISFIASLIFNYIASIYWVFNIKKRQTIKDVVVFVVLSVVGLGINQVVMYYMTVICEFYYMLSKLVATMIVMVWNFITRKVFIER